MLLLLLILAALFIFAVALNKQFASNAAPHLNSEMLSLEEKLEFLASNGIALKPEFDVEALLQSWSREQLEQPGFELLLSAMGGTEEQEPWRYLSSDVWHFDTEAIEDNGAYVRIAQRLVELAGGALPLQDIRDFVNLDAEKAWLSFTFQGELHHIDLELNDDWVDPQVFDEFVALLAASDAGSDATPGEERRFVYHDLGGQDLIIACLNAQAFERLNERGLGFMAL